MGLPETENEPQPRFDSGHRFRPDTPDSLPQKRAIGRDDLRDIDYRLLPQTGFSRGQADIAGSVGETFIRCDDDREYRGNAAAVECIRLNDQDRPRSSGVRGYGIGEISPPDLASYYFHSPFFTERL